MTTAKFSFRLNQYEENAFNAIYKQMNENACKSLGIDAIPNNYPYKKSQVMRILIRNAYEKEVI